MSQESRPSALPPRWNICIRLSVIRSFQWGDLARRSNISEVYFRRVFKQMFGMSPVKYITQLRIEHAKTLLETYTFSVEKAAEMSGFSDVKYFGTVFKKQTGMLPSHFKRGIAF